MLNVKNNEDAILELRQLKINFEEYKKFVDSFKDVISSCERF